MVEALFRCPRCTEEKPRAEVYLRPNGKILRCKVCQRKIDRDYYASNPERRRKQKRDARRRELLKLYGLTPEAYAELVRIQDGCCVICDLRKPLQVDHHHVTGAVRFLLCGKCNRAEGLLDGDPERAERLARYLRVTAEAREQVALS